MRVHEIAGHGGVPLHVRDVGPVDAPAILLVHGWSQHHLAWTRQIHGPLAEGFRLVAPDLRGHGASGKPPDPAAYDRSEPWGADLAAILAALALERPVLVGWSMGGWVVGDYLRLHGDRALAGVAFVGSPLWRAPGAAARDPDVTAEGMYSEDQAVALPATIAFLRACLARAPEPEDLATMTGFNMLVPPAIRRAARLRPVDYRPELAALARPALLVQGEEERVCTPALFALVRAALPGAEVAMMPGSGHAPFLEDPARFDAVLSAFVLRARATP